jgi:ferric-dicitrate binding protein FerR (iron transport regulator)
MPRDPNPEPDESPEDHDRVAAVLRRAGRREQPPEEWAQATYATVAAHWETRVRRKRQLKWSIAIAASCLLGVALTAGVLLSRESSIVATVVEGDGLLSPGHAVRTGDSLITGASHRVTLATTGETTLYLAPHSEVIWRSPAEARLETGTVYVDTGRKHPPHQSLRIETRFGTIEHLGTQFLVVDSTEGLVLSVREGAVRFEAPQTTTVARQGERLTYSKTGTLQREPIPTYGAEWSSIDAVPMVTALEGRSLATVLEDVAYRSGLELEYAPRAAELADRTILHGPALDLPVADALAAVLATTSLHAKTDRGRLIVTAEL